jgi:membrane protease YdiL (CAAX protease family)
MASHNAIMLSFSTFSLIAVGAVVTLALIGGIFYTSLRSGWMKHGYFTIPSVILIVVVLFIMFQGLGSGITLSVMGAHFENHPIAALSINGLAEIAVLLVGAVLISRAIKQNPFAVFRLEGFWETPPTAYILAIPIMLLAQMGGSAISVLAEHIWKFFPTIYQPLNSYETAGDSAIQSLVTAHGPMDLLLIFLFVAIVPAFSEETLFRGFAQTNIERSGSKHTRPFVALVLASILFAAMHASVFKFPGLLVLGLTLGWLTYRTNNLFTGALAHALNNGFIVAVLYLNPDQLSSKTASSLMGTEEISGSDALIMLLFASVGLTLFLLLFHRITTPLQARGNAEREFETRLTQGNNSFDDHTINEYPSDHYE